MFSKLLLWSWELGFSIPWFPVLLHLRSHLLFRTDQSPGKDPVHSRCTMGIQNVIIITFWKLILFLVPLILDTWKLHLSGSVSEHLVLSKLPRRPLVPAKGP